MAILRNVTFLGSALAVLLSIPEPANAVGTRTFDLLTIEDLSGGELASVAVDSRGSIRAGFQLGKLPVTDAPTVWSSAIFGDSVLLGTGNEGKVIKIAGGQASVFATTGAMAVSAMTPAFGGDVVAGAFPKGQLFRFTKGATPKAGEAQKPWVTLEGADYVWALAFDAKQNALYAATGPEGKIFRVDAQGKAQVYFDADESHVVSLALGPDGTLYAGSSGKGLLWALSGPGRARVVHDFDADDVSAIAVAKDGSIYATANKYGGSFTLPSKPPSGDKAVVPPPSPSRPSKAGEGVLYRFRAGSSPELLIEDKKTHFQSLAIGDDNLPYVGTGAEGRVYTVNDDHNERLVADVESRQIGGLVVAGGKKYLVGSDPAVFHEIKGEGGTESLWTSKVLDAGLVATWGMLGWRGTGGIEVMTRSGNTQEPDTTWSAWSASLAAPGKVTSPPGRFVQLRAKFAKDPKATLGEIRLAFLTENARAIVTAVTAESKAQRRGSLALGITSSGGKAPKPSATVSLKWEVDNPDKDDLRYRIFFRQDTQTVWRDALKPAEVQTSATYEWDTTSLPEGLYRIKIEATDEMVNPPERTTRHALESTAVLVDNTPPVFKSLSMTGRKLQGEVTDGLGPIARIEIALAGSDDWRPLFPMDLVFDDPSERFDSDVSTIVPAGSRLIGVRAFDQAGNVVSKEIEAK